MDFALSAEQAAVADAAAAIFAGHATPERLKTVEASEERIDRALWAELARANLLGLAVPPEHGGSGLGFLEVCALLEQQGRRVAPIPLLPTVVLGGLPLARFGSDDLRERWLPAVAAGEAILTAALDGGPLLATRVDGGWMLDGDLACVPAATVADRVLVPAASDRETFVAVIDPRAADVDVTSIVTTNRERQANLRLRGTRIEDADVFGDGSAAEWLHRHAVTAVCALQLGVCEEAVALTAAYTSEREQFGKPLSTFQGVALRAADAHIDTEAIRVTMWRAAWRLAEGADIAGDASFDVGVAKVWAAEGGHRVVHACQHLHGGMGADVDYPVHRYYLWGKQLTETLGGASKHVAALGRLLAAGAR